MLELKKVELLRADEVDMDFTVTHSASSLRTTLAQDMRVTVNPSTGKVSASLKLDGLEAATLDDARHKMAVWCERMAAALRYAERQVADLPTYTRPTFEKDRLPRWLQAEFDRIVEQLRQVEDEHQFIASLVQEGHPLVYVPDALAVASCLAEKQE